MNHEPNKLALLISLICAGASAEALGKAAEHVAESATLRAPECPSSYFSQSHAACTGSRNLTTPQARSLILSGIREAEAGSLAMSLLVPTSHSLPRIWREADESAVLPVAQSAPPAIAAAEPDDPLERANAAVQIYDPLVTQKAPRTLGTVHFKPHRSQGAPATASSFEHHPPIGRTKAVPLQPQPLQPELQTPPRGDIVSAPSAQRVLQALATIRVPLLVGAAEQAVTVGNTLDTNISSNENEAGSPAASPHPEPTLTPSAEVLVTLNNVLNATSSAHTKSNTAADADTGDDAVSLRAAIAARQEVKRMKQRARAEAAALQQTTRAEAAALQQTTRAEAAALERAARTNPFGGERLAVRDNALDRVRGGFVTNNLNIAFGIERAVYINGSLVTTTSLNISDTGRVTTSTDPKSVAPGTLALIQSGTGNSVATGAFSAGSGVGLSANAIGTVVQNTLDGQKIQNITVINATANSLGVLRDLNLQNSLRSSIIDALRR